MAQTITSNPILISGLHVVSGTHNIRSIQWIDDPVTPLGQNSGNTLGLTLNGTAVNIYIGSGWDAQTSVVWETPSAQGRPPRADHLRLPSGFVRSHQAVLLSSLGTRLRLHSETEGLCPLVSA